MLTYIEDFIKRKPKKRISYAEYMDLVLYDPEYGYYMKNDMKIGREGDFITTSNFSDIYGKLVAKWYAGFRHKFNLPAAICEIGGGNGRFAKAFLDGWSQYSSSPISYTLIETSAYHRKLQSEELNGFKDVVQYKELGELGAFHGLIFSNELFDALPVHVIEKRDGELFEVMITYCEGGLSEVLIPLEREDIKAFVHVHRLTLSNGQRIEIPLEMENVIKTISQSLVKGIVITVDYGYTKNEWKAPARKDGSLRGYYSHQMYRDILQFPGRMDITSHVHFDALIEQGEKYGLGFIEKHRQDEFFLKLGILDELQENDDSNPFSEKSKQNRAIRNLIIPGGISSAFHVIIQEKAIDACDQAFW
ncbi:SAM-dependent methyltransferase [Bacillus sp. B15-48]|uniref:class I SAM-dependent methyltransferase n=1 Tax=Bacillus sp. B15-48 TaxID=1548601 RepID=UPI00193EC4E2|nr:SAM-dependent methyltransferase [Bacillus sp. B15-48]MBM4762282.1 SAM-dependent methyltransferase [Bacillus sp. B15-48]